MFVENKYTRWYRNIIANAKKNNHKTKGLYFEKHHIIPRCMGGKDGDNLVRLTAREHFICHHLLVYMTTNHNQSKMIFALQHFRRNNSQHERESLTSRNYETIRILCAEAISKLHSGKIVSETTKIKQKETWKNKVNNGYVKSIEMRHVTSLHSKEMWKNNREKMMKIFQSDSHRNKISNILTGKKRSQEIKDAISIRTSGENNPNSKVICLQSPQGEIFKSYGNFADICKSHDLPVGTMYNILYTNYKPKKGKCYGWTCFHN